MSCHGEEGMIKSALIYYAYCVVIEMKNNYLLSQSFVLPSLLSDSLSTRLCYQIQIILKSCQQLRRKAGASIVT